MRQGRLANCRAPVDTLSAASPHPLVPKHTEVEVALRSTSRTTTRIVTSESVYRTGVCATVPVRRGDDVEAPATDALVLSGGGGGRTMGLPAALGAGPLAAPLHASANVSTCHAIHALALLVRMLPVLSQGWVDVVRLSLHGAAVQHVWLTTQFEKFVMEPSIVM